MSLPNVRDIVKIPGRLSMNPVDITTVYPHGGTALGIVKRVAVKTETRYNFVTAEEFGGERVEGAAIYNGIVLAAILHSYDADMIGKVFANTTTGATSGKPVIAEPSTVRAGNRLSDRSCVLCFTPDDEDRHPMLIMRRALPAIEETTELVQRLDEEWGLPVVFYGIRDTSARLYSYGLRRDLAL